MTMITTARFVGNSFKLLTFSIVLILLICSGTLRHNKQPVTYDKCATYNCTLYTTEQILQTPMSYGNSGEMKLNIPLAVFSGQLRVNHSEVGVNKFMQKENFVGHECKHVARRFFRKNETYKRTALASIPGSGNTWTRHLIEEITGIYTGSIYSNPGPISLTFLGEKTENRVIVTKTHRRWNTTKFDRAVLIVRDPFESSLAEYNRRKSRSQTKIVSKEQFDREYLRRMLDKGITSWPKFNEEWMLSFPGPVFVLFYDKLKLNLRNSLAKLSFFLGTEINLKELWCVGLNSEGSFHRPPKPSWMSRSLLLNADLEDRIKKAKQRIYDLCLDPKNRNKISSNL